LRKLASSLSNQSSAVIWTLEEFLNSKNILQTLIGGMSTCRKFVSQATLIERPAKVLRAARYNGEMIMAGKGHLRITILNREVRAKKAPTLLYVATPGQSGGGGTGGVGGGAGGGGAGSGGGSGPSSGGNPRNLAFLFAALLAVGGFVGYKKKGSTASLKASGGFAAALVVAGYLIGGPYTTVGLGLALVVNLVLGVYMGKGFLNTKKVFPQLVFSIICAVNTLTYLGHIKPLVT